MDVVFGAKRRLQLATRLHAPLPRHHRVATGDSGACGVHRLALFDDRCPVADFAAALVGVHVVDFSTSFRKWAVVAHPVALAGHEENQFAAHLALDAALRLVACRWLDRFGQRR